MEEFEYCWEPRKYVYLRARRDAVSQQFPNLQLHDEASKWIQSRPDAFCNTTDADILKQVLNNYDQETTDFYRWTVHYTTQELSELAARRSGIDFGTITDLIPLDRGTSGRIWRLKIVGTKRTMIIGKELEIRRTLSPSHLYSSAFTVEKTPDGFTLHGAGWGHGVGLCQIGAAVMGAKGYSYQEILAHYFPGSQLSELYK
jgi:SpoIID/LytB domain protein